MTRTVFIYDEKARSRALSHYVMEGYGALRSQISVVPHVDATAGDYDLALFYGLHGQLNKLRLAYAAAKKSTVLFDLGYWNRIGTERFNGTYRIAVNGLHGTPFFSRIPVTGRRYRSRATLGQGSRARGHIVVQGQSAKAAGIYGLAAEEWERTAIAELRRTSTRSIVYVPKNSWDGKRPLEGTEYHDGPVEQALDGAFALVAHHSNAAIMAIERGLPVSVADGVALDFSVQIPQLEEAPRPDEEAIRQFMERVSWLQWSTLEIRNGTLQRFLQEHLCTS